MDFKEYQELAGRTINKSLKRSESEKHALHGLVGEIGELHSLYQKVYQGHEYCTANGWNMEDVAKMNIDKLKARYPDGFETEKSLHRKEGDV